MKEMHIKRNNAIDSLKGWGIILMVMGHVGFGSLFGKYIHAFHMPLFFIISGYLINLKDAYYEGLNKKFKTLIIPYMFFTITLGVFGLLLFGNSFNLKIYFISKFWINTDSTSIPISDALWFLTCLFFMSLIFNVYIKILKNNKLLAFLVGLSILIGTTISNFKSYMIPFGISIALGGIGFMYVGFIVKLNKEKIIFKKILNMPIWCVIILFIINLVTIYVNGYTNMRIMEYSNVILFYFNAILATLIYYNIFKKLDCYDLKINKFIQYVGKNSIVYLCLNQFVIIVLKNLIIFEKFNNSIFKLIILNCLVLIATMMLLYVFSEILNRTKLRIFIGKF